MSSIEPERIASSRSGSGGTTGSGTGSGGPGGRDEAVDSGGGGGGGRGLATGGLLPPHAARNTEAVIAVVAAACRTARRIMSSAPLVGPVRLFVVAGSRDLPEVLTVAGDREDLLLARSGGVEGDVPPVGCERRAFVGAFAECQLPHLARREIDDLDVVARPGPRGVGDLVERRRRPGRPVRVAARELSGCPMPSAPMM